MSAFSNFDISSSFRICAYGTVWALEGNEQSCQNGASDGTMFTFNLSLLYWLAPYKIWHDCAQWAHPLQSNFRLIYGYQNGPFEGISMPSFFFVFFLFRELVIFSAQNHPRSLWWQYSTWKMNNSEHFLQNISQGSKTRALRALKYGFAVMLCTGAQWKCFLETKKQEWKVPIHSSCRRKFTQSDVQRYSWPTPSNGVTSLLFLFATQISTIGKVEQLKQIQSLQTKLRESLNISDYLKITVQGRAEIPHSTI